MALVGTQFDSLPAGAFGPKYTSTESSAFVSRPGYAPYNSGALVTQGLHRDALSGDAAIAQPGAITCPEDLLSATLTS